MDIYGKVQCGAIFGTLLTSYEIVWVHLERRCQPLLMILLLNRAMNWHIINYCIKVRNEHKWKSFFSISHFIRSLLPSRPSVTQLFLIYCICSHKKIKLLVVTIITSLENMNGFHFPSLLFQIKGFVTLKKNNQKNEATITFWFFHAFKTLQFFVFFM